MGINAALDSVGESILQWADPENQFRGYTQVCIYEKEHLYLLNSDLSNMKEKFVFLNTVFKDLISVCRFYNSTHACCHFFFFFFLSPTTFSIVS